MTTTNNSWGFAHVYRSHLEIYGPGAALAYSERLHSRLMSDLLWEAETRLIEFEFSNIGHWRAPLDTGTGILATCNLPVRNLQWTDKAP